MSGLIRGRAVPGLHAVPRVGLLKLGPDLDDDISHGVGYRSRLHIKSRKKT